MVCENCQVAACYCDGLPEQPIEEITVENIRFTYDENAQPGVPAMKNNAEKLCRAGMYFDNVKKLTVKNIDISGHEGDQLIASHVDTLINE